MNTHSLLLLFVQLGLDRTMVLVTISKIGIGAPETEQSIDC